jgi:NADH-quinone oxidoreductase subunit M
MPWLTILIVLPLVGGALVGLVPTAPNATLSKQIALGVSLLTLVLTSWSPSSTTPAVARSSPRTSSGSSLRGPLRGRARRPRPPLVVLTAILTPVVIIASWHDGADGRWGASAFFGWMLALEGLAIGVFAATDVFLFYVLFEATLIPIYFLVGGWGGPQRTRAAVKFLVYSLAGGLVMLASVVGLYVQSAAAGNPSYLISDLASLDIATTTGRWLFVGFFVAFAIKAPMFPVHTWLPDTTQQATPGTSVLLVSILDKIGTFGMVRFCLGIFRRPRPGRPRSSSCSPSSASCTARSWPSGRTTSPG